MKMKKIFLIISIISLLGGNLFAQTEPTATPSPANVLTCIEGYDNLCYVKAGDDYEHLCKADNGKCPLSQILELRVDWCTSPYCKNLRFENYEDRVNRSLAFLIKRLREATSGNAIIVDLTRRDDQSRCLGVGDETYFTFKIYFTDGKEYNVFSWETPWGDEDNQGEKIEFKGYADLISQRNCSRCERDDSCLKSLVFIGSDPVSDKNPKMRYETFSMISSFDENLRRRVEGLLSTRNDTRYIGHYGNMDWTFRYLQDARNPHPALGSGHVTYPVSEELYTQLNNHPWNVPPDTYRDTDPQSIEVYNREGNLESADASDFSMLSIHGCHVFEQEKNIVTCDFVCVYPELKKLNPNKWPNSRFGPPWR
jgi:hypothetical protein